MKPGDRVSTPTALKGMVLNMHDEYVWVVLDGGPPATFKMEQLVVLDE